MKKDLIIEPEDDPQGNLGIWAFLITWAVVFILFIIGIFAFYMGA